MSSAEIGSIIDKVKGQHYQIACGKCATAVSTLGPCPALASPPSPPRAHLPALASPPRYFEAKHKGSTLIETELGGISHPNQYFEESSKFHAEKELKEQAALEAKGQAAKAPPAQPPAQTLDAVMVQA